MDEAVDFVTYAQRQLRVRDSALRLRQYGAPNLIQTDQMHTDESGNTLTGTVSLPVTTPPSREERLYIRGTLLDEFMAVFRQVLLNDRKVHLNATTKNYENTLSLRKWTLLAQRKQIPLHFQHKPRSRERLTLAEQRDAFCEAYNRKTQENARLEQLVLDTTPWLSPNNYDVGVLTARALQEMKILFDSDHPVWLAPEAIEVMQHELLLHSRRLTYMKYNCAKHDKLSNQCDKYEAEEKSIRECLTADETAKVYTNPGASTSAAAAPPPPPEVQAQAQQACSSLPTGGQAKVADTINESLEQWKKNTIDQVTQAVERRLDQRDGRRYEPPRSNGNWRRNDDRYGRNNYRHPEPRRDYSQSRERTQQQQPYRNQSQNRYQNDNRFADWQTGWREHINEWEQGRETPRYEWQPGYMLSRRGRGRGRGRRYPSKAGRGTNSKNARGTARFAQ